jgi:hypothetical protein
MNRTLIAGLAMVALVSGGLGLGAGTALADTGVPHQWCPGDTDPTAPTPGGDEWDWNVCHTYYWTNGKGNVPYRGYLPSELWDGDNPPDNSAPACGHDMFTGLPGSC